MLHSTTRHDEESDSFTDDDDGNALSEWRKLTAQYLRWRGRASGGGKAHNISQKELPGSLKDGRSYTSGDVGSERHSRTWEEKRRGGRESSWFH